MNGVSALFPKDQISEEQLNWNATAIGLLKNLVWRIETNQIRPKEMAVVFVDYRVEPGQVVSQRRFVAESTSHSVERIVGILEIAKSSFLNSLG